MWRAILTRVFVRTAPEWGVHYAGLILARFQYPLPVSSAMLDEIAYVVPRSRNLIGRCERASNCLKA